MEFSPEKFDRVTKEMLETEKNRSGIGTLSERLLHSVIKRYIEPDSSFHEIKIGKYFADIFKGGVVTEIQTRDLYRLREKISFFSDEYKVNIVYPIVVTKRLRWIDPETGEISAPRLSPKHENIFSFVPELYGLRPIMPFKNLSFHLFLIETDEYKLLSGKSRDRKKFGAARYERIPSLLREIVSLSTDEDFKKLLPECLPDEFSANDFKRASGLPASKVNKSIQTLRTLNVIDFCRLDRKRYIYKRKEL